ncbi:LOW QUALITY PROTEIN: protein FAM186A [Hipposideros larvatus]
MQLSDIMQSVQRIITRYTVDETLHSRRKISFTEYKRRRMNLLEKIAAHANSTEIKENTLVHILAWLEEWNGILSEMTAVDVDEHHRWIAQLEILPETFRAIESNVNILIRISSSLLQEKKKQKKKITSRGILWKSWKERVIKRPATANALRPDQMISDEFARNIKVSEIQGMLQELIDTAMFNKLENSAIKYISSTIVNLSKALSALKDEVNLIDFQSANVYIYETNKREKELSLKIIQDLSEKNVMLQQKLQYAEEKCEQLIRSKVSTAIPTSPLSILSELSLQSSMAISKADKEDSILDSILAKQLENIIDEAPRKGTKVSGIKWDSAISYTAQVEMTPDLIEQRSPLPGKKKKTSSKDITEDKVLLKKDGIYQKDGTDQYQSQKRRRTKGPHVWETSVSSLSGDKGKQIVSEPKVDYQFELQALEKKSKERKSFSEAKSKLSTESKDQRVSADFPSTDTKSQGGKSGTSSMWEQARKVKLEYLLGKHQISSENEEEPTTESIEKESKSEMIGTTEPFRLIQHDHPDEKVKTKGKEYQISPGTTASKEEETEEKDTSIITKKFNSHELVKSQSGITEETSESTRGLESSDEKGEQNNLEEFQKAIIAFLKEKIDNTENPLDEKTVPEKELLLNKAEVEKLEIIKAKMEEYFQNVAETVIKILRKHKDIKYAEQVGEEPMKQKVSYMPGLHIQKPIRVNSKISTLLSSESMDPIVHNLIQMILTEIESERDVSVVSIAETHHKKKEKQRQEEYLQEGQEKIFDINPKDQLGKKRNLWKKSYKMIKKNLKKEKEWLQMKEGKKKQQKYQWQEEEVWEEQQKHRIEKHSEQDEKQKQMEEEEEEQQKQKQQQLKAWEQTVKKQGVLLEKKGQQMGQVQKEVKHLELESRWEKEEEKQKRRRKVEDHERQWQKKGKDQMKIKKENSEELKEIFGLISVPLSLRKNTWNDASQLHKTQNFHGDLKTLESLADEEHPMPITSPTFTQSSSPGPFPISGQSPTKSIADFHEEAQALGITVTPEQAQAQEITVTPEQAQALGITVTPEQAQALGITVTPEQAQALGITFTPEQAHTQGITVTPKQAQAQGVILTPEQAQALGITFIPQQAQAQGITLTPEQAQAFGIIVTPEQAQALGITVTPEQAQAQEITVTPEQAQALGITVTPEQAQALGITVTPEQAQALGITFTPEQAHTQGITVTPKQAQAQGVILTPEQAQALGITFIPQQAQAQGITLTPQQAQAFGIIVTPEQAQALGITVTPKQAQAQGINVIPEQAQALGITFIPEQAQAQGITLTPEQSQALGVIVTREQAQAQSITLTPQQALAQGITLTPKETQTLGTIVTHEQATALGITVTPKQAQVLGVTVTPQPAKALGVTVTPGQAQAQRITVTLEQAKTQGITVTPKQAQAQEITVTPEQAKTQGITVTPKQGQAQGFTITPEQAKTQGITVTPKPAQAQGITVTRKQAQVQGITVTPKQAQAQGITVTPKQAQAEEIIITPEQAKTQGIIVTPKQAQAQGITITPKQAQGQGITVTPKQAQGQGITVTPEQAQAQGITVTPKQAQAEEIIITPEQAKTQGIIVTPKQAQAQGITITPKQAQAQGITITPKQAQGQGITVTPKQAQGQGITVTPEQAQAQGITVTPKQAQAEEIIITPEQAKTQGIIVTPKQAQAQGITITPKQAQGQGITVTPKQAQAQGITVTPEQAQAQGITVTPEQAQSQGITVTPEQAQALGITVTPHRTQAFGITVTHEQAQALGVTVIPEQAQALRVSVTPEQAQAQGFTVTPQQAKAQTMILTPQQAHAFGVTVTPEQAQVLGITATPQQAQAFGITVTPEQSQALGVTVTPEQAQAQGITVTPEQAQALGITLTPQQSQAQGITLTAEQFKALVVTLTPEKSRSLGVILTHEQVQALRSPLTLEQDWTLRGPITPKQDQMLKASVTSEQTWAMQIPVTTQQAQKSGVPISQGQDEALGVIITPQQTQALQDLLPEQAQALELTLTPEKVRTSGITCTHEQAQAVGVTLTPEQEQASRVPLTLEQAQALETSLTEKQAWKLGVSSTPGIAQEVSNILTLRQNQALGVPIAPQNAWMSAVTLTPEQTQALGTPLTSDRVHALGPPITCDQVQPLGAPFTPGQAQPVGITHMFKKDLKSRALPINEQPSQLWADPSSGHTLEVRTSSITDKCIKPRALHIPKQSLILAPSTIRPPQESKASLPSGQPMTSRTRRPLASSVCTAEKSSVFEVSSTPLQISRSPVTQAVFVPRKSLGTETPSYPRKVAAPQTFPSSRQTLVSKSQSTSVQLLAPEVPPTVTGKLPISGAPPTPGQPLALDSLHSSRQFLMSRDSLTPQSCLISKAPLAPRQPLIAEVPPTTSQIPTLLDPLFPGKPLAPGTSSIPGKLIESGPLISSEQPQAFQPPATCEQSPYLQTPSTLGQRLTPWTLPGQASPLQTSPTPGHPSTLWAPSTPGQPQKDLPSSVSKRTFQSYLTNDRTPVSETPYIDEGALPTLMKPMTSLPALTTPLPKTSQISSSEWDQKFRFPPINKPCILTSVPGTKKPKMMVPPSSPQELKEQRYFVDVGAQRKNLILLHQATETSGLPSELQTTARNLIIETLYTDTFRLGYLFRKYIAYRLIQRARNNINKRLQAIQNSGKGYEMQNLYIMLSRIDDYQKKMMAVWIKKQKSLEQKRNQCLRKMMYLFSQIQEMHKLNLSQPIPLIINKNQIPAPTKFVQQPFLELLEKDRRSDIFKKFRQEDHMEALWNADQSTSSYPITEKTSINSLWAQLGGYPAIPMLLQLDVQSTFRKSLASVQSQ